MLNKGGTVDCITVLLCLTEQRALVGSKLLIERACLLAAHEEDAGAFLFGSRGQQRTLEAGEWTEVNLQLAGPMAGDYTPKHKERRGNCQCSGQKPPLEAISA